MVGSCIGALHRYCAGSGEVVRAACGLAGYFGCSYSYTCNKAIFVNSNNAFVFAYPFYSLECGGARTERARQLSAFAVAYRRLVRTDCEACSFCLRTVPVEVNVVKGYPVCSGTLCADADNNLFQACRELHREVLGLVVVGGHLDGLVARTVGDKEQSTRYRILSSVLVNSNSINLQTILTRRSIFYLLVY